MGKKQFVVGGKTYKKLTIREARLVYIMMNYKLHSDGYQPSADSNVENLKRKATENIIINGKTENNAGWFRIKYLDAIYGRLYPQHKHNNSKPSLPRTPAIQAWLFQQATADVRVCRIKQTEEIFATTLFNFAVDRIELKLFFASDYYQDIDAELKEKMFREWVDILVLEQYQGKSLPFSLQNLRQYEEIAVANPDLFAFCINQPADFRNFVREVRKNLQPDDSVLLTVIQLYGALLWYMGQSKHPETTTPQISSIVSAFMQGHWRGLCFILKERGWQESSDAYGQAIEEAVKEVVAKHPGHGQVVADTLTTVIRRHKDLRFQRLKRHEEAMRDVIKQMNIPLEPSTKGDGENTKKQDEKPKRPYKPNKGAKDISGTASENATARI